MSTANCSFKLLIRSASQVVQVVRNGELVVKGEQMNQIAVLERSENIGLSIVISRDGKVFDIGDDNEIQTKYEGAKYDVEIDAYGKCILPGFVDCHTHPVWAGDRVNEFAMKLAGATYLDVHKAGGGIYSSVEHTQRATEDQLLQLLMARLKGILSVGTTLLEAKSGYGLDVGTEMKMLRVIERAKHESPIEISSTFCGAHAIPRGMKSQEATESIIYEQLPAMRDLTEAGHINVDSIDVFCEKGVFDIDQTRQILKAGRSLGLRLNFHGDELYPLGSAELAAELKAEAISHLERISSTGIEALSKSGTVAIILPTTAYILKLSPPPVRQMIQAGVPIALGSDFNPNAFCMSMPLVMHLACVLCGMTMAEALIASTINSAAVLGRSKTQGSLEKGKMGDIVIINAPRWEHIIYQLGVPNTLIEYVIKSGRIVYKNTDVCKMI